MTETTMSPDDLRRMLHEFRRSAFKTLCKLWAQEMVVSRVFPGLSDQANWELAHLWVSLAQKAFETEDRSLIDEAVRELQQREDIQALQVGKVIHCFGLLRRIERELMRHMLPRTQSDRLIPLAEETVDRLASLYIGAFAEAREQLIARQAHDLLALSAPITEAWPGVLLLPLVGRITERRSEQIIERLLLAVAARRASVTIVDITGVSDLDGALAAHLLQTIEATQLLGTHVILTGVGADNAMALARRGVDLKNITTKSSMYAGLKEGLRRIGCEVVPRGWQESPSGAPRIDHEA
jgi:rsbT co-antagonist protein RsbR